MLRSATIGAAVLSAAVLLAVATGQPWFQEACGAAGLPAAGAAAAVGLVALVAGSLAVNRRDPGGAGARRRDSRECPECGQPLLPDWRMCPYCGASVDRSVERRRADEKNRSEHV
ncbi:MAG: zinc ribbon domain-containing protein [Coriobacteriia bacterium]|nr:zinc ribbon domain-containing protein [Coriobacteriia bacterium]